MGTLLTFCRPRKRIAPAPSTADPPRPQQEATPSRAVRSCRTAGLPSAAGATQMSPTTGGPDVSAHRRRILGSPVEPHAFYKSLREAEGGAMTKDKFSKYSPLPDISRPHGRPLLRQKTYDVLEPVYVKGPPSPRHAAGAARNKPPPPRTSERGRTATVTSRTVTKESHAARDNHATRDNHASKDSLPAVKDNSNPLSNRRSTKLPHLASPASHLAPPAPHIPTPAPHIPAPAPAPVPAKRPQLRRTSQFRPQELSKDILPQSPTAFWFPI